MASTEKQPVPWEGPKGWRGEALPDCARFPFHEIGWSGFEKAGDRKKGIECVKSSRSRRVLRLAFEVEGPSSGRPVYAKRYLVNTWRRKIGNRIAGSKAAREFAMGHRLLEMGLPTPLPLAYAQHRTEYRQPADKRQTLPPASYLLTEGWPNQGSIKEWLRIRRNDPAPMWKTFAHFLAAVHERGFYHDDCSADHILIAEWASFGPEPEWNRSGRSKFCLIDIDNGKIYARPVSLGRRFVNLFQVMRSLGFESFPGEPRRALVEDYRRAAGLADRLSLERCCSEIERVARRKIGGSVLQPGR